MYEYQIARQRLELVQEVVSPIGMTSPMPIVLILPGRLMKEIFKNKIHDNMGVS